MKIQRYYLVCIKTDVTGNSTRRETSFPSMSKCYAAYIRAFNRHKKFFTYFKDKDSYYSEYPDLGSHEFEKPGWYDHFGNFVVDRIEGTCEFSFTISKDGFNPITYKYELDWAEFSLSDFLR